MTLLWLNHLLKTPNTVTLWELGLQTNESGGHIHLLRAITTRS